MSFKYVWDRSFWIKFTYMYIISSLYLYITIIYGRLYTTLTHLIWNSICFIMIQGGHKLNPGNPGKEWLEFHARNSPVLTKEEREEEDRQDREQRKAFASQFESEEFQALIATLPKSHPSK